MEILLPPKKGAVENVKLEFEHLVVVGANGAGKTRFGSWVEEHNYEKVHRISAQKSLSMPSSVCTTSIEIAEEELLYGTHYVDKNWLKQYGRINSRWSNNLNTSLLNDYEKLMILLHSEEYEKAVYFKDHGGERPLTKLDIIQRILGDVLPHRKLEKRACVIDIYPEGHSDKKYNGSEMSDGERCIFYLIGEVLCAPENSIIIIDEPEMHIHVSLIKHLFDLIETERPDCAFIYLTHSMDFAFSRQSAIKIWAKSYEGNNWDYEILNEKIPIPEQLYLEVLGSRLPVIFIEGDNNSIDYEIYSQVFTGYTLKPVNSCIKVIQIAKSFNDAFEVHHIQSYGIIDRDRRDKVDVNNLVSKNVWVLDVAEAENLLLLEDVVKVIANHMGKNPNDVFSAVRKNLIDFFAEQMSSQVLLFFKEILSMKYQELIDFRSHEFSDVIKEIDTKYGSIDRQAIYDKIKDNFQEILDNGDYNGILRVFNLKNALLPHSKVCEVTGVRNKEEYRKLLITLLKKNDANSERLKDAIKAKIIMTPII